MFLIWSNVVIVLCDPLDVPKWIRKPQLLIKPGLVPVQQHSQVQVSAKACNMTSTWLTLTYSHDQPKYILHEPVIHSSRCCHLQHSAAGPNIILLLPLWACRIWAEQVWSYVQRCLLTAITNFPSCSWFCSFTWMDMQCATYVRPLPFSSCFPGSCAFQTECNRPCASGSGRHRNERWRPRTGTSSYSSYLFHLVATTKVHVQL